MIALAVSNTINECMGNHYYTFGGGIFKQSDGGAIGTDIAGEIARCVMSVWDVTFLKKLRTAGIHMDMYKRYVDDQLDVCPPINPGWKYDTVSHSMVFDPVLAVNDCDEPAIRTAKILQQVANSIEKCIQVTYDTPEGNLNQKMPVLDLEVWVSENKVHHRFYKKPVACNYTIMERSALPAVTKTVD